MSQAEAPLVCPPAAADTPQASGGLLLLEHININVGDQDLTRRFHCALGCQQAQVRQHMNCGPHTQFHMPVEKPVQVWRGEITVAYSAEGLAAARERLRAFAESQSDKGIELGDDGEVVLVQDPWGNRFRLREGSAAEKEMAALRTKRPKTEETVANGVLGIVEISLPVPVGKAAQLARFYEGVFNFQTCCSDGIARIMGGPVRGSQSIKFVEQPEVPPYNGDHFAIYIRDFESVFSRCAQRDLLYVNPRFTHLDNSRTLEQAEHWQAFRIMEVRDDAEQQTLLVEEHEIRSANHKFMPLVDPC